MLLHSDPLFSIAFGDKQYAFEPQQFCELSTNHELLEQKNFIKTRKAMGLDMLIVPKQTHGTQGIVITNPADIPTRPYQYEADFIVTNLSNIGIGVATADCLPIIFYDSSSHTIAVAHAGWKGSLDGIAIKTIKAMQKHCGTRLDYLKVFFGPCAKVGNYEVGPDFIENLKDCPFAEEVLITKNGKTHFNLPMYNQLLLENFGVNRAAFKLDYNICTIANETYCSHRREQEQSNRQMTIAMLK